MSPTHSLKSILLIGALAGAASAAALQSRDDKPLKKYQAEIEETNTHISSAVKCYTEFMRAVKANSPPGQKVLDSLGTCDLEYDGAALKLRDARRTAQGSRLDGNVLFQNELPDVLDGRDEHRGEHTEKLQQDLADLAKKSRAAFMAYRVGRDNRIQVMKELRKKADEQKMDVSQAVVKEERSEGGSMVISVAGVLVAGVAVAGVITYGPFVEAVGVADATLERLDEAVARAVSHVQATREAVHANPDAVTLGQLKDTLHTVEEASEALDEAHAEVGAMGDHLAGVSEAEVAEADAVYHAKIEELGQATDLHDEAMDTYQSIREIIISAITHVAHHV